MLTCRYHTYGQMSEPLYSLHQERSYFDFQPTTNKSLQNASLNETEGKTLGSRKEMQSIKICSYRDNYLYIKCRLHEQADNPPLFRNETFFVTGVEDGGVTPIHSVYHNTVVSTMASSSLSRVNTTIM